MKPVLTLIVMALLLSGCGTFASAPARAPVQQASRSAAPARANAVPRVDKVNLLLSEANRLAGKVQAGQLSRAEAAVQMNVYRLKLVGANRVDDSTYATYLYLAQQRDAGTMTQEESHARMESKLRDWSRSWPKLSKRPADPAFTNFLLRLYDMPPLGQNAQ